MHDVKGGSADCRRADDLGHRLHARARLDEAGATNMDEYWNSVRCGQSENFNHLVSRCTRRVLEAHAHAQRTGVDLASERGENPIETVGSSRFSSGGTGLRDDSRLGAKYADGQRHIPGK